MAAQESGAFGGESDPDDVALERKAGELERRLASAVASEDYAAASAARDEINRLHMDEVSSVLRINSQFYDAMTDKDAERMAAIWSKSDLVQNIQPGSKPVQGHESVLKVYRSLFSQRDGRVRRSKVSPGNVRVHVRGTSAWVTCTEEVRSGGALRQRLCATNIFRKEGGRWFVTHHHASPYPTATGGAGGSSGSLAELLASGMGSNGGGGPRIIALGSGSGEGIDQSTVEDIVNSIRSAMAERESGNGLPSGIISFGVPQDGDDGDGDNRAATLKSLSGLIQAGVLGNSIDSGSGRSSRSGRRRKSDRDTDGEDSDGSDSDGEEDDEEDDDGEKDLSRRAVAAVRHVCAAGMISAGQKRSLLTDVIRHASSERPSAVEVAFELLLAPEGGEAQASADSLAEFAEQCKVFAEE